MEKYNLNFRNITNNLSCPQSFEKGLFQSIIYKVRNTQCLKDNVD